MIYIYYLDYKESKFYIINTVKPRNFYPSVFLHFLTQNSQNLYFILHFTFYKKKFFVESVKITGFYRITAAIWNFIIIYISFKSSSWPKKISTIISHMKKGPSSFLFIHRGFPIIQSKQSFMTFITKSSITPLLTTSVRRSKQQIL